MTPTSETHISTQVPQLEFFWKTAISEGLPVALWRLPKSTEKQLLIDLSGRTSQTKIDLEELPSGFAMSPFIGESLFLKGDLYYHFDQDNQLVENNIQPSSEQAQEFFRKVQLTYDEQHEDTPISSANFTVNYTKNFESPTESSLYNEITYAEMVSDAIDAIQRGDMQKVVLSRTKQITLPENFEVVEAFNKLCVAYPNAFVSLVYLPQEKALWLGATPKRLLAWTKRVFLEPCPWLVRNQLLNQMEKNTILPKFAGHLKKSKSKLLLADISLNALRKFVFANTTK
jgi:isochorismate synthase